MTPMYRAILQLFANLAADLAARNLPEHSVHAYVFGGCAVHMHTRSRASSDVDVEFDYDAMVKVSEVRLVLEQLPPVDYDDPVTGPSQLIWDANFNTTFGPLHEDYQARAQEIERAPGSPVVVWLPSAEDLALSKLGRFADVDQNDILELLSLPESSWELFESLARDVSGYYVGPPLDSKIAYIRKRLEKHRKKP
ncbi:MAG TPA: DUF6036 family nucleotidyltransferase [Azonexus sp.]|nr:DUF6036 family nucleotidyltransferase [Azonexus sp.]